MRKKMIRYIERVTGCQGVWHDWSNQNIRCIYTMLLVGAPHYRETELNRRPK